MPIGEDPAAQGHWCAFIDLYHTIPYQGEWELISKPRRLAVLRNRRLNNVALLATLRSVRFSAANA